MIENGTGEPGRQKSLVAAVTGAVAGSRAFRRVNRGLYELIDSSPNDGPGPPNAQNVPGGENHELRTMERTRPGG